MWLDAVFRAGDLDWPWEGDSTPLSPALTWSCAPDGACCRAERETLPCSRCPQRPTARRPRCAQGAVRVQVSLGRPGGVANEIAGP